jgi:DNA-binding NarL/FixJ family response regulator
MYRFADRNLEGHLPDSMHQFRTLIVDDVDGFRRVLRSMLEERTECEVVGEAFDGLQAVSQAEQLQPDLVLLDLGLPTINGIEVARRIRKLSPNSKILFVTQNSSREIAQGALRTGANGYLLKSESTDLLAAVETVISGEQYVSSRVKQI